ncbi:hypothetical protein [Enterovirga aerilata]|uniref:Uncharacterized protein n=1 Tax=Enterovirga aerilata TaxID=2730920 RepID=A0A849IFR7_9HYPH|nr:hypothetical protein [Enterovirga sp. DB1703]NNM75065.1 hypothetical protein [Enterovirga sp. DB1703]
MLKWLLISGAGLVAAFLLIGALSDPPNIKERIDKECEQAYRNQGQLRVDECRLEMTVRYVNDAERSKSQGVYDRIR